MKIAAAEKDKAAGLIATLVRLPLLARHPAASAPACRHFVELAPVHLMTRSHVPISPLSLWPWVPVGGSASCQALRGFRGWAP